MGDSCDISRFVPSGFQEFGNRGQISDRLHIGWALLAPESSVHIEGVEFYDKLSFLKAGLIYASHLTTVSANYAKEITTPELGCGLEGLLRQRSEASELTGILNGIDESWDPRFCAQLAQPFAAGDWEGKRANADYVRKQFGLAVSRGPIFGLVARLVHQKGIDLVLSAADAIVEAGGQIVVTGSGEPAIEQALVDAHRRRPDAISVTIGFNDAQARRIFAASDFTLRRGALDRSLDLLAVLRP